ncbi:O-antigen ligase family protein [Promineifilum sp.]|uniref:O-antigen ligase family protein n=1 Tax=Promineifilum sp. TaxID=2664178 RepID=UPI0035B03003
MSRARFRNLGFAALLLLAFSLPFELETPWLRLGPLVLTNVEIILATVLALALLAGPHRSSASEDADSAGGPADSANGSPAPLPPRSPAARIPRLWLALALWFILGMAVSAWLAPEFRGNALKATLRTVEGLLVVPALLWLAPSARRGRMVALALVAGGLLAALIGLAEHLAGYDFTWLAVLRPMPTYAGPFLRLSGSFDYANQAAIYIEATLPFLFALTLEAAAGAQPVRLRYALVAAGILGLLLYTQAAILTFSRAGFITLILVIGFVATLGVVSRWRLGTATGMEAGRERSSSAPHPPSPDRWPLLWAGLAAGIVALVAANWLLSPSFRLRLQSEVDTEWYRSQIDAPAELELRADELRTLPITVTNQGTLTWQPEGANPFHLGVRWQLADTGDELLAQPFWPLTEAVPPGGATTLQIPLRAPVEAGEYRLIWDMEHENVNWFDARGDVRTVTAVTVVGEADSASASDGESLGTATAPPLQFDAPLPGRRELWAIALRLIREHPLTGIGLDNYRLTYSRFRPDDPLPGTALDQTVHSNNWYLETVVSLGIVGALPFLIWLIVLVWGIIRSLRHPHVTPMQIAAGAGLLAFVVHGLLDYFLLFNATAILFWMIAALWLLFDYDDSRI